MIVGVTGSGKTHALKYILSQTPGIIIVLDPHATPKGWPDNCHVKGAGRQFVEIQSTLQLAEKELDIRYQARAKGRTIFTPITLAFDELPSIVAEVPEAKIVFSQIAREGRKVNLFLAMSTQSDRVKTLGITGEGDVRDNFIKIAMPHTPPGFKADHKTATMTIGETKHKIIIPREIAPSSHQSKSNPLPPINPHNEDNIDDEEEDDSNKEEETFTTTTTPKKNKLARFIKWVIEEDIEAIQSIQEGWDVLFPKKKK